MDGSSCASALLKHSPSRDKPRPTLLSQLHFLAAANSVSGWTSGGSRMFLQDLSSFPNAAPLSFSQLCLLRICTSWQESTGLLPGQDVHPYRVPNLLWTIRSVADPRALRALLVLPLQQAGKTWGLHDALIAPSGTFWPGRAMVGALVMAAPQARQGHG